jgi:inorganic phosphate transporter, PiT family
MESVFILHIAILLIGFYMAWNIGANDVSNAMGTSVGSGALTMRRAVYLAAIFEFSGAFTVGASVTETIQSGLIQTQLFAAEPLILVIGMCGALLGASIWLQVASYFGLPVSTTHAIIGAILGFACLVGGLGAIQWDDVSSIALSWILSPVLSGIVSYVLFRILQHQILFAMSPAQATRRFMPIMTSIIFGTFSLSLLLGGLGSIDLSLSFRQALLLAIIIGSMTGLLCYLIIRQIPGTTLSSEKADERLPHTLISLEKAVKHLRRVRAGSTEETREQIAQMLQEMHILTAEMRKKVHYSERTSEYGIVEKWFIYFQMITACFVAFSHGANDVSNAIGPVAVVLSVLKYGAIQTTAPIPIWLLAFGGAGIIIGLATWGWRVIQTIGKKLTELTPTRGFCAEFGASLTILIASKLGMPISTTHCLVGSVLGVGLARGIRALNLRTIKEIVLSWIITLPASALMSIICYYLLKALFN